MSPDRLAVSVIALVLTAAMLVTVPAVTAAANVIETESETNETISDTIDEIDETDDATETDDTVATETMSAADADTDVAESVDTTSEAVSETTDAVLADTQQTLASPLTAIDSLQLLATVDAEDLLVADAALEEPESTAGPAPAISEPPSRASAAAAAEDAAAATVAVADGEDPPTIPAGAEVGLVGLLGLVAAGAIKQGSLAGGSTTGLGALAGRLLEWLGTQWYLLRYSRRDGSDPLEHERRAAIHDAVHRSPGASLTEVAEEVGLAHSTARYHLRILEREGTLSTAMVRGRRRLYPVGTDSPELAAAMNDEATAPILDVLARRGPASVSTLADALGKDPSTITHHLSRLEDDGIVVRERDGRAIENRLAPAVAEALDAEPEPMAGPAAASSA